MPDVLRLTIRDPLNAIPDLVIESFDDGGYSRSIVQQIQSPTFTATGVGLLTGTIARYRFTWELAVSLPKLQALHLESFVMLQDRRYSARQDGRMILIDEFDEVPPEPSPHSKTLLASSTLNGLAYGYAQFNVKLMLGDRHKTGQGVAGDGTEQKLVQFSAIELP